jgi:hypothetical protein
MTLIPPEHRRVVAMMAVTGITFCVVLAVIALLMR